MKPKMTISELKSYIISEAKKLIKKDALNEEKKRIEALISEIDKKAMDAAKRDIEADGGKFVPLGKSKFEKNINKKELKKAMSPEKVEESEELPKNDADHKEQPGYIHEKRK